MHEMQLAFALDNFFWANEFKYLLLLTNEIKMHSIRRAINFFVIYASQQ